MRYKIAILQRHLYYTLVVILICNSFFLTGTCIANNGYTPVQSYLKHILYQIDLGAENNVAAWYSSMLLFMSSIMCIVCFAIDCQHKKIRQYLNFGWIVFSLIFSVLSFDELGSVHENIGDSLVFKDAGKAVLGDDSSGWIMFMALAGFVSLFMIGFSLERLRSNSMALLFLSIGILLYLSNPFQENFEIASHQAAANPETWKRPVFFLFLEEGSEIFGSLCFLIGVTLYALKSLNSSQRGLRSIEIEFESSKIFRFTLLVIIIPSVGLLLTEFIFGNVIAQSQVGVPKNWFPSMIAFLIFLYSLNTITSLDLRHHKHFKTILLITSVLGVGLSLFYGSNLYAYPVQPSTTAALMKNMLSGFISVISFIPSVLLFIWSKNAEVKVGAFLWSLICIALFSSSAFAAEMAFVALCCLLYTLTIYPSSLNVIAPDPTTALPLALKEV